MYNNKFENFDLFFNPNYLDYFRSPDQEVNRILQLLNKQQPQLFTDFQSVIENYFKTVIAFTIDNPQIYTGNINQRINRI